MKHFKIMHVSGPKPIGVGFELDENTVWVCMNRMPAQIVTRAEFDRASRAFGLVDTHVEWVS